jgi:hypothetical protein
MAGRFRWAVGVVGLAVGVAFLLWLVSMERPAPFRR